MTSNELNEYELINIMLEGIREAAGCAKDLHKLTKNLAYSEVFRHLTTMAYLAEKLATSKAMTEATLMSMVDRAANFQGKQQDTQHQTKESGLILH